MVAHCADLAVRRGILGSGAGEGRGRATAVWGLREPEALSNCRPIPRVRKLPRTPPAPRHASYWDGSGAHTASGRVLWRGGAGRMRRARVQQKTLGGRQKKKHASPGCRTAPRRSGGRPATLHSSPRTPRHSTKLTNPRSTPYPHNPPKTKKPRSPHPPKTKPPWTPPRTLLPRPPPRAPSSPRTSWRTRRCRPRPRRCVVASPAAMVWLSFVPLCLGPPPANHRPVLLPPRTTNKTDRREPARAEGARRPPRRRGLRQAVGPGRAAPLPDRHQGRAGASFSCFSVRRTRATARPARRGSPTLPAAPPSLSLCPLTPRPDDTTNTTPTTNSTASCRSRTRSPT